MREAFSAIRRDLDRVRDRGATARFWWRDDDAIRATPALERLIALSHRASAAPALAVIPATAEPSLAERLHDEPSIRVLVHGFSHDNHAPSGAKRAEFGRGRPLAAMAAEAARGRDLVRDLFGRRAMDVFVPPWNRMVPALAPALRRRGFRAVSAFGPRRSAPPPGIAAIDTHLDPVDWRGSRSLLDPTEFAPMFARAIAGAGSDREPIGLLTHHLCFDDALWGFCEDLLAVLSDHPAAELLAPADLPLDAASSNCVGSRELILATSDAIECSP